MTAKGDSLVTDHPETQRRGRVHHRQWAVDDEVLGRQKRPHLLEDVAPFRLAARLWDSQALQEGDRLLPHLEDVSHPLIRGRALRIAAPSLRLHDQRECGPSRVDVLEGESVGVHPCQARQVPRARLPCPKHSIALRPEDPRHLLRRRALAPVHLRSDLQGRVNDWVDVVPLTREWVGPALQGQDLLRRELELLVRALGDLTAGVLLPDPPKHP